MINGRQTERQNWRNFEVLLHLISDMINVHLWMSELYMLSNQSVQIFFKTGIDLFLGNRVHSSWSLSTTVDCLLNTFYFVT